MLRLLSSSNSFCNRSCKRYIKHNETCKSTMPVGNSESPCCTLQKLLVLFLHLLGPVLQPCFEVCFRVCLGLYLKGMYIDTIISEATVSSMFRGHVWLARLSPPLEPGSLNSGHARLKRDIRDMPMTNIGNPSYCWDSPAAASNGRSRCLIALRARVHKHFGNMSDCTLPGLAQLLEPS